MSHRPPPMRNPSQVSVAELSSVTREAITEVGKRQYRAYFKSLEVAKQFRADCGRAGYFHSEICARPHGWMVRWTGIVTPVVPYNFAIWNPVW